MSHAWGLVFMAAACSMVTIHAAAGQPEPPRQPLDVNAVRPVPGEPAAKPVQPSTPDVPRAGPETLPLPPGEGPTEADGPRYRVSRFVLRYQSEHPGHPDILDMGNARVTLSVTPTGYVSPREGAPRTTLRVGDVIEGGVTDFYGSAIREVARAIADEMSRRGLLGSLVQIDPEDIDELGDNDITNDTDLRRNERSELRLILWTAVVKNVRTIASGPRLVKPGTESEGAARIDSHDAVHARIRRQSPVKSGDLLRKIELDNYIFRLNRHPGRRVDVALAPASGPENPEAVQVDYLVSESKPWSIYGQISNTGTKAAGEWRERFGFVHNQLTKSDDVLRVDYITAGFEDSHAVTGSYEFPILSDAVRTRVYGTYSTFVASDVGSVGQNFEGRTIQAGAEVAGTVYQHRELFLDLVGGARWQKVRVNDPIQRREGEEDFLIPYISLRMERLTNRDSTFAALTLEGNLKGIAMTNENQLDRLGRLNSDASWYALKFNAEHSMYLEPFFDSESWFGRSEGKNRTLAHEVSASIRGQHAFGSRLIPNEEDVAGGLYSVRGYNESVTAGDNVFIASFEYRFHLPRIFPVSEPGYIGQREFGWSKDNFLMGKDFRLAPQQAYGEADWDLILRAFVDAARVTSNDKLSSERDNTLIGTGLGMEFRFRRNLTFRADWGFAMRDVEDGGDSTSAGSSRLHLVFTLLY